MRYSSPLISGRFLLRKQRFLAQVELAGGERVWAHVPNTGVFKAYKLTSAAGAYLKGDSKNVQLTRVRGL